MFAAGAVFALMALALVWLFVRPQPRPVAVAVALVAPEVVDLRHGDGYPGASHR